jgi:hypothetical protein
MAKIGPNELCTCGSGRKFKKCCGDPRATDRYTRDDRAAVFDRLNHYIDTFATGEEDAASDEFWGEFAGRADELPPERAELFGDVEHLWFVFDRCGADGTSVADRLLAGAELTAGQRAFLTALRRSSMRIYEVTDASPGASLTLRDAIEGGSVTVNERQASRTIARHEYLAARIVPQGPSGGPEIEAGLLHIAPQVKQPLLGRIEGERARFVEAHGAGDLTAFYKRLPALFHEVWVGTMLG